MVAAGEQQSTLPRMTEAEYVAFEASAEARHAFRGGEVVAVSGGAANHAMVNANLTGTLGNRLRAGPLRRLGTGARTRSPDGRQWFYADAMVFDGPVEEVFDRTGTLSAFMNPVAAFEVLSEATEAYDRGDKFDLYRGIPSLTTYALVDSRRPAVHTFERQENDFWLIGVVKGEGAVLPLATLGIEIPFAELYENVTFEEPKPRGR